MVAARRMLACGLIGFFLAVASWNFSGCGGSSRGPEVFGLAVREAGFLNFPAGLPQPEDVELTRAYPNLSFSSPLFLTYPPDDTDRIFVVEKGGEIHVFVNDDTVTSTTVFLDIAVDSGGEQGLLGLAFDPDYENSGEFYVYYTAPTGARRSVISRFTVSGDPDVADDTSEEILLEVNQPFSNHNAGMLAFGPDGDLYIAFGDGGSAGDPFNNGQNRTTLLGSLLRIDPSTGDPYDIPPDNPFVGEGGEVREEIFAYGLRNPWRFSFDRVEGDLWVGDVGQGSREEISIVENGDNLGWRVYEGELAFENPLGLPASDFKEPVHTYARVDGQSVTGGYVYRGSSIPALEGVYVYGDYASGTIWGLVADGVSPATSTELGSVSSLASFGEDEDGELYAVSLSGSIWRFQEGVGGGSNTDPPDLLSETGIFTDLQTLETAPGLIGYDVNASEWADGAMLRRWIFIPGTSRIAFSATDAWDFPAGTVFVKHFEIDLDATTTQRLETRVIVRTTSAWRFHLYRWNAQETDADLLTIGDQETITVTDSEGTPRNQVWTYPSTAQCMGCHNGTEVVLGVHTRQMNRNFPYPLLTDNQLRSWNHIGLFTERIRLSTSYDAWPDPGDSTAPVPERARAYLDVNCAMCHRPGGPAPTDIDLRFDVAVVDMNVVGIAPSAGDLGLIDPLLVRAGEKETSVLWERQQVLDSARMPPLSGLIDEAGVQVIGEWIDDGAE